MMIDDPIRVHIEYEVTTNSIKPIMNPPGNPTENTEIDRLNDEVIRLNSWIAQVDYQIKVSQAEKERLKKNVKSCLNAIETIKKLK